MAAEQTKADHSRPKHSDIRGATSISDALIYVARDDHKLDMS